MRAAPVWSRRHLALLSRSGSLQYPKTPGLGCTFPLPQSFSPRSSLCRTFSSTAGVFKDAEASEPARDEKLPSRAGLKALQFDQYPRIQPFVLNEIQDIHRLYRHLKNDTKDDAKILKVAGRVSAIRIAGSKLIFVDILEQPGNRKLQIVLLQQSLKQDTDTNVSLKEFGRSLQKGDIMSVGGYPHRTAAGEMSILATGLPTLLSPCFHDIPHSNFGEDSDWAHDKHVEMLSRPDIVGTMVVRSTITQAMQKYLTDLDFVMVQTPILAAVAGGAAARPFETTATEFSDRKLAMRIAPELWLKRLIVGGVKRVAEIGPSFRNEGLDKTHNPEFTTCEFYAAYWSLKNLQQQTQAMINYIASEVCRVTENLEIVPDTAEEITKLMEESDWAEIDFIPALNTAMDLELPNLAAPDARERLLQIFTDKDLPLPSKPTLPRLVDKLSSIYLEPQCEEATWIIHPPECLSPLAKSFIHPSAPNSQPVAARAELFIQDKEVVNCYEEENSPIEQRRKFIDQQTLAKLPDEETPDDEAMKIDEDYLRALEWGLPPTGGWGCGVDRLVMLFTGKERISDVLSFGNLRQVTRGAERWGQNK